MNSIVKFRSFLYLKSEEEGGRRTPIENGFRTDLRYGNDQSRIVAITFDGDLIFPGESKSVICNVLLHSEDEIDELLGEKELSIADGATILGATSLESVINREEIKWM